ncbi:MAG: helix-turn-helix transcriptional regulator [Anaerolineae bacterium]|nr:helix-turn-helix transcriptional regulator [Anaerolineae bacterium]
MENTVSFGYWVRRQRKALDLTQAHLARQVGCAAVTIKKIERDERRPSRQMAERLADSLAVPQEERQAFIQCGLGQQAVDTLSLPAQPIAPSEPAVTTSVPAFFELAAPERVGRRVGSLCWTRTPVNVVDGPPGDGVGRKGPGGVRYR